MKEVYCKNCKWLKCLHKDVYNAIYKCYVVRAWFIRKTPLEEIKDISYQDYKELNKDNNCSWYKRKWWKFWIKVIE